MGSSNFCSDIRLKHDVAPLTDGGMLLAKLLALEPVTFVWNNDSTGKKQFGLAAQQVETVVPEIVTAAPNGEQKGISCTGLDAVLIQGIKEQQRILNAQSETIRLQEQRIEVQQRKLDDIGARLAKLEESARGR